MEILPNIIFSEIDYISLASDLSLSSVGDIQPEINIVSAIFNSQKQQALILPIVESYVENMRKYSKNKISIKRFQLVVEPGLQPIVNAGVVTIDPVNSDMVQGLMKRSSINDALKSYFWKFGDNVFLTNNITRKDNVSYGMDIMSTTESISYYFLKKESGQVLFSCTTNVLGMLATLQSVDDDRVIGSSDMKRFFYALEEPIDIHSKTLFLPLYTISSTTISTELIFTNSGNVANRIFAASGAVTLSQSKEKFLNFDNPTISIGSSVPDWASTNTISVSDVSVDFSKRKAPFKDWTTFGLRKGDSKDQEFVDGFVSTLLSGNSIPKENINEYKSLVSKNELMSILTKLGEEIVNMDVCNDN